MIWAVFIVVLVLIFGVVVRYSRRLLYGGNYLYNFSDEKFAVKVRRFLSAMPAPAPRKEGRVFCCPKEDKQSA